MMSWQNQGLSFYPSCAFSANSAASKRTRYMPGSSLEVIVMKDVKCFFTLGFWGWNVAGPVCCAAGTLAPKAYGKGDEP
jgi:hypothetical protein